MVDSERVFQDREGEISLVNGKTVERFLCVMVRDDETNELGPGVFWLKMIEEDHWNRFFVDVYCGWDIYSDLDQSDLNLDEDVFPVHDIGEQFSLQNKRITHVDCSEDQNHTITLRIVFSSGEELRISTTLDSDSNMEFVQK
jgi:hypothetical protein